LFFIAKAQTKRFDWLNAIRICRCWFNRTRPTVNKKWQMAVPTYSNASTSAPSSTDETKFNNIRDSSSSNSTLSYADFGYFTQEDLNELKEDWNLRGESKGRLQGIWKRHPENSQGVFIKKEEKTQTSSLKKPDLLHS
jgi:hypothetical protein